MSISDSLKNTYKKWMNQGGAPQQIDEAIEEARKLKEQGVISEHQAEIVVRALEPVGKKQRWTVSGEQKG